MPESTHFTVVVNSTEWRSLLGLGQLRLSRRRVQEVHNPPTSKERNRLFGWGPTTVLGDGNDVVVLELSDEWHTASQKYPAHPSELLVISTDVVTAHYSVGSPFYSYLVGDAEREGVLLSQGRYEDSWNAWNEDQKSGQDLAAATELLTVLGLDTDLSRKRADGYTWHDIIRLARNSKTAIKPRPKHVEDLLRAVRPISDAVAGVHATAAFDLAVNVEWIQARTRKDPLAKVSTRVLVEAGIESGKSVVWSRTGSECQPVADALAHLSERFPRAYTAELTPQAISATVRLVMAAKDRTLDPMDVPSVIASLGSNESAKTLTVAISGALGPLVSRRLVKVLSAVNLTVLDWS